MRVLQFGLVTLAILLFTACSEVRESDGSPLLHRVAEGGIIEINVPFHANSTVRFRNGETLGWFSGNTWTVRCDLNFKGNPATEITTGRYEITRARNQQLSLGSNDFSMITRLTLKTLSGLAADSMECSQRGSWNDVGNAVTPITVQQFKRTVGKYLTLTLSEDNE